MKPKITPVKRFGKGRSAASTAASAALLRELDAKRREWRLKNNPIHGEEAMSALKSLNEMQRPSNFDQLSLDNHRADVQNTASASRRSSSSVTPAESIASTPVVVSELISENKDKNKTDNRVGTSLQKKTLRKNNKKVQPPVLKTLSKSAARTETRSTQTDPLKFLMTTEEQQMLNQSSLKVNTDEIIPIDQKDKVVYYASCVQAGSSFDSKKEIPPYESEENQCENPCRTVEPNKCQSNPCQDAQGWQGQAEHYNNCQPNPCLTKLQRQCQQLAVSNEEKCIPERNENICKKQCPVVCPNPCQARQNQCQPCETPQPCIPQTFKESSFEVYRPTFKKNGSSEKNKEDCKKPSSQIISNDTNNADCKFQRYDVCDIPAAREKFTRDIEKLIQVADCTYSGSDPRNVYGFNSAIRFMRSLRDDDGDIPRNICLLLSAIGKYVK